MRSKWLIGCSLLVVLALLLAPPPVAQVAYRAVRATASWMPVSGEQQWLQIEGEKIRLYYQASDQPVAVGVLEDLEESWEQLAAANLTTAAPATLVAFLHPSHVALQAALGQRGSLTLGAYQVGRLHLLSPLAWLPGLSPAAALQEYRSSGPAVHELVHLGLDYLVAGNTPLWFSEGLAQYWELELNGYLWQEPGIDWLAGVVASDRVDALFGSEHEYVAYRQSLQMVQYLYNQYGPENVHEIVVELALGRSFQRALQSVAGIDTVEFERGWLASLVP